MKAKVKNRKDKKGTICINCGQSLNKNDNFCPNCGQINDTSRVSLKQHLSEYLVGFFSFDNRFFTTIFPLLFKPGKVTREYIDGKRIKYVNPFQMYLFISIIFFLIIGLFNTLDNFKDTSSQTSDDTNKTEDRIVIDSLKNNIAKIKKDYTTADAKGFNIDLNFNNDTIESGEKKDKSVSDKNVKPLFDNKMGNFMTYNKSHKDVSISKALKELGYKKTASNIFFYNKAQDLNKLLKGNPDYIRSYANNFVSKISIALFFLLPLFTLLLSLLYLKSDYNYSEHLVFVFHVQTVFFIMLTVFILFDRIFGLDTGISLFLILFPFYLYKALRNFYEEKRFKTIVKFFTLNTVYFILSVFGLIIVAFIAFLI